MAEIFSDQIKRGDNHDPSPGSQAFMKSREEMVGNKQTRKEEGREEGRRRKEEEEERKKKKKEEEEERQVADRAMGRDTGLKKGQILFGTI